MKKLLLVVLLALCETGLVFADFEGAFGFIGGLGPAAEVGLNLQLGYMSPTADEGNGFRWGLLADLGIGYRYGIGSLGTYSDFDLYNEVRELEYKISPLGYNLGLLAEFYFLPFMGVSVGGGVASGVNSEFTPYIRAEVPFLLGWAKLGLGFDYILWKDDEVPAGITLPPGYRINLFIRFRGEAGAALLRMWFG